MILLPFALILISASIIDYKTFRIPNYLTLGGFLALFALKWYTFSQFPVDFILSALISFALLAILSFMTKGKMGMGDAKLSLSIGGVLGGYYWLISLFIASTVALFYALFAIKCAKISKESPIPFAPFLSVGALVAFWLMKENFFAP